MEWINIKDELPITHSQHNRDFLSDEVGVWTDEGFSSDKYVRNYNNGVLISQGWVYNENVTHWFKPTNPLI